MIVAVSTEHRFDRTPDGRVWTSSSFAYPFWQRYLDVFDGVRVVARTRDVAAVPGSYLPATGEGVHFACVPYFVGAWQYMRRAQQVRRAARGAIGEDCAVILRVASTIANTIYPVLRRKQRPYGVEVVGDPWDMFGPGVVDHPFRPLIRRLFTRRLKTQTRHAMAASYVTAQALQERYPAGSHALKANFSSADIRAVVGVSDVELPSVAGTSRTFIREPQQPLRVLFVGTLAQLYKAPDLLIDAVALCRRRGIRLHLTIVGDGGFRPQLEKQAKRLGIAQDVLFRGQLNAVGVREELMRAELYVLPSHTEGLPRAMIEAMAVALPCIGSTVGGIPELLAGEDLVPPRDVNALARKLEDVARDPERMRRMSERNLVKAQEYNEAVLHDRRVGFYKYVRERTEAWLVASKSSGY